MSGLRHCTMAVTPAGVHTVNSGTLAMNASLSVILSSSASLSGKTLARSATTGSSARLVSAKSKYRRTLACNAPGTLLKRK